MLYSPKAFSHLEQIGQVTVNPLNKILSDDELIELAWDSHFIITTVRAAGSKKVFESLPNLLAFIRAGVDLRNVDQRSANEHGILICNCPGIYEAPVVELVIGYLCAISRRIVEHAENLKHGNVHRYTTPDLYGKTLGLIGYGSISRRVAKAAETLGMHILICDPFIQTDDHKQVSLEELLTEADFVSVHAALNQDTEGMIGERELALMKPSAWLINTARGLLIREDALYTALQDRTIAGAALDVFATEPDIAGNPLIQLPNVIATPHIGGWSTRVYEEIALKTAELVEEMAEGKIPDTAVNKDQVINARLNDF